MYPIFNVDGNQIAEVPGKTVACATEGCGNGGVPFEVPDHPSVNVVCGPCGQPIEGGD